MNNTIIIGQQKFTLYREPGYNSPHKNERTVELPLGFWFYDKYRGDLLELGAVLPYYRCCCKHPVVDTHDLYKNSIRLDATAIQAWPDTVLSLSTVEHIGFNDYSTEHGRYPQERWDEGFPVLERIAAAVKHYLVTFAVGNNPVLDALVADSDLPYIVLRRVSDANEWRVDPRGRMNYLYGPPQGDILDKLMGGKVKPRPIKARWNNANAVCVVTNQKELYL